MLPDRVSNPGPLTCESGALPSALHGPKSEGTHCCYNEGPLHNVLCQAHLSRVHSMIIITVKN